MGINLKLHDYLTPIINLKANIAWHIFGEEHAEVGNIKTIKVSAEIKKFIEENGIVIDIRENIRVYEYGGTFVQLITD